jgi:hypothetical protein
MKNREEIYICEKDDKKQGFNFKPGFVALADEKGNIKAATSGWECNGNVYVYRPSVDGTWIGDWEDEGTFPVKEVLDAIQNWQEEKELQKVLHYTDSKKLYVSENDIMFTEIVPGSRCWNGGEYGFYTRYIPIQEYPGIYKVYTESTCDLDACGTGYQGIKALTAAEYRKLRKESNKIEEVGSLY